MRIAVLGAGAMGSIYAGHLSKNNDVVLIDKNEALVKKINQDGIILEEFGTSNTYYPQAYRDTQGLGPVDLMIVFVKSLFSKAAIEENKHLLDEHSVLLTLQNGAGHENLLKEFVPVDNIVIGTTEDNGAVLDLGHVKHGGEGKTNIGAIVEDTKANLEEIKACFEKSDFVVTIHDNIQQLIWNKIITNASLSVLTGILQVPIGYIARNEYAWDLCKKLINEVIETGRAQGLIFNTEEEIEKVRMVSINNPEGLTSIYADIKNGRKTEVDTISGAIVNAGKEYSIQTPYSDFAVSAVHALENKDKN